MISFFNQELFTKSIKGVDPDVLLQHLRVAFKNNGFDIDVTFVDIQTIQKLNNEHRKIDKPTDVLSFEPVLDIESPKADVFVCIDYIKNNIEQVDLLEETTRMMIHGILHIMGMDHGTHFERESINDEKMYLEQERILNVVLEQVRNS